MSAPNWLKATGVSIFVAAERYQKLAWTVAIFAALWTFAHLYSEEPWLSYQGPAPFPVLTPYVVAGAPVSLRVRRCNASGAPQIYQIARTLQNVDTGLQYALDDSIQEAKPGCTDIVSRANVIPVGTPAGHYRVLGLSQIQASFRLHYVPWSSQPFEVIAP